MIETLCIHAAYLKFLYKGRHKIGWLANDIINFLSCKCQESDPVCCSCFVWLFYALPMLIDCHFFFVLINKRCFSVYVPFGGNPLITFTAALNLSSIDIFSTFFCILLNYWPLIAQKYLTKIFLISLIYYYPESYQRKENSFDFFLLFALKSIKIHYLN